MVEITLNGATAQIDWGKLTSKDSILLSLCESLTYLHPYKSIPSNPDPDYDVAQYVSKVLEATITHAGKQDFVAGRMY